MEKINIQNARVNLNPLDIHSDRRPISYELGTTDVAINYFRLEPGESTSGLLHTHKDQEEVFYVEEGSATFTVGSDKETVVVNEGELIRFSPGEFQRGDNTSNKILVIWAIGAPGANHDWEACRVLHACSNCCDEREHLVETTLTGKFKLTCIKCKSTKTLE